MKSGVYKITNVKNGKFYIGSAKDIDRRWWEHKNDLKKNKHINPKLQHAWDFYGETNFDFIILENTDETVLVQREQFYLDMFKP
jgi:group I intron endonuclease